MSARLLLLTGILFRVWASVCITLVCRSRATAPCLSVNEDERVQGELSEKWLGSERVALDGMNDTARAQRLVADDADHLGALANPSDIHLAQLDRDIHDPLRRGDSTPTPAYGDARDGYELEQRYTDSKGAAGLSHGGQGEDDDRATASGAWAGEGAHARRSSSASYARLDTRTRRSGSFGARAGEGARRLRFDDGQGGEKDGSVDKRRLQVLWWRSAAVNVLFILAWCVRGFLWLRWPVLATDQEDPSQVLLLDAHFRVQ